MQVLVGIDDAAPARDGFRAVEFLFPYEFDVRELRSRLDSHGLTQALFNAPPGDWEKGERGLASLPGREEEFQASIKRALEYAAVLGNERLHVMAGLIEPGLFRSAHRPVYMENLRGPRLRLLRRVLPSLSNQ